MNIISFDFSSKHSWHMYTTYAHAHTYMYTSIAVEPGEIETTTAPASDTEKPTDSNPTVPPTYGKYNVLWEVEWHQE